MLQWVLGGPRGLRGWGPSAYLWGFPRNPWASSIFSCTEWRGSDCMISRILSSFFFIWFRKRKCRILSGMTWMVKEWGSQASKTLCVPDRFVFHTTSTPHIFPSLQDTGTPSAAGTLNWGASLPPPQLPSYSCILSICKPIRQQPQPMLPLTDHTQMSPWAPSHCGWAEVLKMWIWTSPSPT